jgi:subtilisin family serine protease
MPVDDALVATNFPGRHPITDLLFHGTHVAATVASNALALAGMTSQVTLMGVKVCTVVDGTCDFGATIMGFLHAVDNGADVINLSLGGGFPKWIAAADHQAAGMVGFINSIFSYAKDQGVTVVVAAGNEELDLDKQPALYKTYCDAPNTICVSATGPTSADSDVGPWYEVDAPADYTNYGRSAIDVAAPGGTDAGLIWGPCSQTSLIIPPCQTGYFILGIGGTSMAAPHVSGLAALLVEDLGRNPGDIQAAIKNGADDLGQRGVDKFYGRGRINVMGSLGD